MPAGPSCTVLHYVGGDVDRGGILSVVRALASTGEFACVLGVNPGFAQMRSPRLETMALPAIAADIVSPAGAVRALRIARRVRAWLRAGAGRIYHGHSRAGLLVGLWLGGLGEHRVAVSVHCYGRQRWFYRWAARRLPGRLFWLSPAMKRYYGVKEPSWEGCHPGCVVLEPGSAERRPPRQPGWLRLGGIGSFVRWKHWELVLEALRRLPAEQREKVEFRHIGDAAGRADGRRYADELRARTAQLGLAGRVEWRGWEASSDALLRDVDALVVASRNEPFSVAVVEALAAGVPVLAADSGGAADIVSPGRTGWLFRSGDPADLARRIAGLLAPASWQSVSITSEDTRRFTAPVVAREWRHVYESLQRIAP